MYRVFWNNSKYSDMKFKLRSGKIIPAHKVIVEAHSAMLVADITVLECDDKYAEKLIEYIYCGEINSSESRTENINTMIIMLEMGYKLHMPSLRDYTSTFIKYIGDTGALFDLGLSYDCEKILLSAIDNLRFEYHYAKLGDKLFDITKDELCKLSGRNYGIIRNLWRAKVRIEYYILFILDRERGLIGDPIVYLAELENITLIEKNKIIKALIPGT